MGTALTEHQLYLLKRFSRRIVLALDSDAAGDRATLRGLQIARQALDHEQEPVFDARGLLGFEARLQADIRVTTLPAGMDPDDIVNRDPAEWQRILENARPVVLHVMETLASNRDLEDPKVKTEIASQVLPLIEDVPSPVERETYRQKLARLLRVDERALLSEGRSRPVRARRGRSAQPAQTKAQDLAQPQEGRFVLEGYCLGVLLRRPDLIYRIDRAMQEARLDRLSSDDFQTSDHQTIFLLIKESLNQDEVEPLVYVMNRLSMPLMDVADGLLERTGKIDLDDKEVFDDILRSLLDLRRRNLRQNMDHLRYLMEEAQYQGDPQATEYQRLMHGYIQTRDRLDRAHGFYTDRPVLYR
jgi:DNA primase